MPTDVPARLYLNGKYTAQRTTGVQRVAAAVVAALDRRPEAEGLVLLCPPQGRPPVLRRIAVRRVGPAGWPLHAWEQLVLPWAARDGDLLSLAGGAPLARRRQQVVLHDAAVFDQPQAYTAGFVAWYRRLFRRLARRDGTTLWTVSAFSRERLAEALAVPAARLRLLPIGADHLAGVAPDDGELDRLGLRGTRFLLAVGSANPTKNLAALRAGFAQAALPGLRLVIAGGGHARVFAGEAAAATPGVVEAGPVDDAALVALYRAALVLVFPSTYEGFGLPPLEAMAQGCPVLASRCAAIPEACGDAADYLDGTDATAIAAGLRRLVADDTRRDVLRAAGHAHAATRRWDAAAAALLDAVARDATRGAPR